ncbi:PREDICTED: tripartite motif-containing protein 65-like [Poecilia mexicana]|uniref:tripartite motif-containing protein 65-like n=1 Tax=Poecilia mexicana TaxID=48701 RepID=UPI00072E69CA|nr:PREDICTED: tripartite motif-containing protein 65-like [Poecilia mexicana]
MKFILIKPPAPSGFLVLILLVVQSAHRELYMPSCFTLANMAHQGNPEHNENFCCMICLDLLKDPVTLHCGHNYCNNCIEKYWDEKKLSETYSCPLCRRSNRSRPNLAKNTLLADAIELLGKSQAAPKLGSSSGREVSDSRARTECKTYEKIEKNVCSNHKDEQMKLFCRTHQTCICSLCSVEEHKGDDIVSAKSERTEKQREIHSNLQEIQQKIKDREEDIKMLQQEMGTINASAEKAVRRSSEIFAELINLLKKRSSDVKQQIRKQQKAAESQINEYKARLETEISELRGREEELQQLSRTDDHVQFIHRFSLLGKPDKATDSLKFKETPPCYFMDLIASVAEAGGKLKRFVHEETTKTSAMETELNVVMSPAEPKTRADFLQRSRPVSLNPNTAHRKLLLSLGNKRVTRANKFISPLHPDRFTEWAQALSTESFTGCCYWEVKWTGRVTVAVATRRMSRTGRQSEFGSNTESWALECYRDCFVFGHDGVKTCVSGPQSSTVGVYLDHTAGSLFFFSVSDSMELLHRVQTTFTQPLHAGLWVGVCDGSAAEFC